IGDADLRQRSRLLFDEHIHGALDLFLALHLDPSHFTIFGEPPKLGAVAPARRRQDVEKEIVATRRSRHTLCAALASMTVLMDKLARDREQAPLIRLARDRQAGGPPRTG